MRKTPESFLTKILNGKSFRYTYNKRNHLVEVVRNSVSYATYGYNALEQMTSRTTSAPGGPTGTVHYVYDREGHLLAEADAATGATVRDYIWLPANDNGNPAPGGALSSDLNIADAANDNSPPDLPLAVAEGANLYQVHADHLGRPIRMTDGSKATVWQATWRPWGEAYALSGTKALNLRFPGQYFQIETGLHSNWHRHYDPVTGRYSQPDPLRFVDGPSLYAYATSSPLLKMDSRGLALYQNSPKPIVPPNNQPTTEGDQICRAGVPCSKGYDACVANGTYAARCWDMEKLCNAGVPVIFAPGVWGSGWGDGF